VRPLVKPEGASKEVIIFPGNPASRTGILKRKTVIRTFITALRFIFKTLHEYCAIYRENTIKKTKIS
jgi:hypothetical protein